MAQFSLFKTKVRVNNSIYELILAPHLFEDVRVRGESSSVIMNIDSTTAISTVMGKFKHSVEILSVEPYKEQRNQVDEAQAMETEVSTVLFI